jgi:hypothetical protein
MTTETKDTASATCAKLYSINAPPPSLMPSLLKATALIGFIALEIWHTSTLSELSLQVSEKPGKPSSSEEMLILKLLNHFDNEMEAHRSSIMSEIHNVCLREEFLDEQ